MFNPDPFGCAERQLARDRDATSSFPQLMPHKLTRMTASPLGYLRGAAPLYYELLQDHPQLAAGPDGEGWLVGDAHLENFGAFRCADGRGSESVVFDVNDFDEAVIGPFRWDVVRLLASVILGGREIGSSGKQSVQLCAAILEGYVPALSDGQLPKDTPPPVRRLLEKVDQRTHKDFLDRRTVQKGSTRRFVRGDRYQELTPELVEQAHSAFARYVERLDPQHALARDHFKVEDVAFRVAGTGSLGCLRIAVLTLGKGDPDNRWIFDMKSEGAPSAQLLVGEIQGPPAERVWQATVACLERPPRLVGVSELGAQSLFVRRLLPQEDKLDLTKLRSEELPDLARYLGARLGAAHRRGKRTLPQARWTPAEQAQLTDHAIVIAGLHEAAYLALCKTA
ncbi:MAG: DUF2252 family protein [Polyangiaceae bacterium]